MRLSGYRFRHCTHPLAGILLVFGIVAGITHTASLRASDGEGANTLSVESTPVAADATVESVVACMRANVPERLQLREFSVVTRDARGDERTVSGDMYVERERSDGRAKVNMQVDEPPEMRGTSYLWRELPTRDETLIHLPAFNRTRRVIGSGPESGVFDSEFSARDLQQMQGAVGDGGNELLGEATLDGRVVWVLRFTPAEPAAADTQEPAEMEGAQRYDEVRVQVDQQSCVTVAADFVLDEEVVKEYRADADSIVENEGIRFAQHATMHNLRNGRTSTAHIRSAELPESLPRRLFLPNAFHLGN